MQIKQFIKTTAVILLHTFLLHELAFGATTIAPKAEAAWRVPLISVQIQPSVAVIEETYQTQFKSAPVIYLIQDAHTNESAQLNIAKTLEALIEKENIGHVFLEGGTGDNSLSYFRTAPLAERQKVAKSLLKQGELSGWEYLDLVSEAPFILWGVEDEKLYWESLRDYKEVAAGREKFQEYVRKIESTIESLKPKNFNPSLGAFDEQRQRYLGDKIPLTDYLEVLAMEASRFQISLTYYPHVQSFQTLREKERHIDFDTATQEQSRALEVLPAQDREALFASSNAAKQTPFKFSILEHADQKGFYVLLEETLARDTKGWAVSFPELFKYFNYLKEVQNLNAEKLLEEQRALETQILARLIQSKDEQGLHRSSENVRFLKKLFDLTLTSSEREQYAKDFANFGIEQMTGFLNRKIMDLNGEPGNVIFLEKEYDAYLKKAMRFYALTRERDEALVRNALKKMEETGERKAVLIAGGYHAPHLKGLLKKSGVSYVSIRPQVYHETNQRRYESILLNQISGNTDSTSPTMSRFAPVKNMAIKPATQRPYILSQLHQNLGVAQRSAGARLAVAAPSGGSPNVPGKRFYFLRYDPKKMEKELLDSRKTRPKDIKTSSIPLSSKHFSGLVVNPQASTQEKLEIYFKVPVAALDKFSEMFGLNIGEGRLKEYVLALIQASSEQDRLALVRKFEDIKSGNARPLRITMGNSGYNALSIFDIQENMITIDAAVLMHLQNPETIEMVLANIIAHQFFGVLPMSPRELSLADANFRVIKKDTLYTKKIFEVAKNHNVHPGNTLGALKAAFSGIKEQDETPYTAYYSYMGTGNSEKDKYKIPEILEGQEKGAQRQRGQYYPLAMIGHGGMGLVVLAYDMGKDIMVAIKIPIFPITVKPKDKMAAIDRFKREIEITSKVHSSSVVKLLDHGSYQIDDEDNFFFVMEYLPWLTLKDWIRNRIKNRDSISVVEAIGIIIRVAEGLKAFHLENVIHRDIKPENIMVSPDGDIKIMDLGLAKDTKSESEGNGLTQSGMAMGTPYYMAPEQAKGGTKFADQRADLYSLGVIFYEMLTEKMPFGKTNDVALQIMMAASDPKVKAVLPSKINPSVDKDVDAIVLKALAKDPKFRYKNASDIVNDLEEWLVHNEGSRSEEMAQSEIRIIPVNEQKKAEFIKNRPIAAGKFRAKSVRDPKDNKAGNQKWWLWGGGIAGVVVFSVAAFFSGSSSKKPSETAVRVTNVENVTPAKVDPQPRVTPTPPKVDPQPKVTPPQQGKPVAFENLVAHFTFDEIRPDGTVVDSLTGLAGKVYGAKIVTDKNGNALNFNGSSDYVQGLNTDSLKITSGTVSAWIKTSGAGSSYRAIISKYNAYSIYLKDNVFMVYDWKTNTDKSTGVNLADNSWHNVVMVFDSGVANGTKLYIDGRLVLTTITTVVNQGAYFAIAKSGDDQFFNGLITNVRIYNRKLNGSEITTLATGGARLASSNKQSRIQESSTQLNLNPNELKNIESFAVKLWYSQKSETGNDFALNFGEITKVMRIIEDTKEGKMVSLTLLVRSAEGERPILVSYDPRKKLEEIQKREGMDGVLTVQDIQSALSLSALNSRMAVPSPANNSAVNYGIEIPLGYFAGIGDPELFRSQLASALAQASQHYEHSRRVSRQVTFLLPGREELADWQVRILNELAKNLPYHLNLDPKSKKFDGVVVELLEAKNLKGQPQSDGKRLFVSIGSLSENSDSVLSWHKAFAIADWLGRRYALDSDTGVIDFTQVRGSDSDLQRVLTYYQTHQENTSTKIQADLFIRMVEGKASSDEYLKFALNLPILKKVPLQILIQAARLALKTIGASA